MKIDNKNVKTQKLSKVSCCVLTGGNRKPIVNHWCISNMNVDDAEAVHDSLINF